MSAPLRPKGPLPARVYWVRRAVVLGIPLVALLVVLGLLFGRGGDGRDDGGEGGKAADDAAALASGGSTDSAGADPTTGGPSAEPTRSKPHGKKPKPQLAQPSGDCAPSDVVVTPSVPGPIDASGLRIDLEVTSIASAACWFTVSPSTTSISITSGNDGIWYSRQCPAPLRKQRVVARPTKAGTATMTWNLRRSDAECSDRTQWAKLGYYHVTASALGGEPNDIQFRLSRPPADVVTEPADSGKERGKQAGKEKRKKSDRSGRGGNADENDRHVAGDDGGGVSEPDE